MPMYLLYERTIQKIPRSQKSRKVKQMKTWVRKTIIEEIDKFEGFMYGRTTRSKLKSNRVTVCRPQIFVFLRYLSL